MVGIKLRLKEYASVPCVEILLVLCMNIQYHMLCERAIENKKLQNKVEQAYYDLLFGCKLVVGDKIELSSSCAVEVEEEVEETVAGCSA